MDNNGTLSKFVRFFSDNQRVKDLHIYLGAFF